MGLKRPSPVSAQWLVEGTGGPITKESYNRAQGLGSTSGLLPKGMGNSSQMGRMSGMEMSAKDS